MSIVLWLLSLLQIRNFRTFRLVLRVVALLGGLIAGFVVSLLMELHEFGWSVVAFLPVVLMTLLEFVVADLLASKAFPFETEQKLLQMERRLGAGVIQAISNRLRQAIEKFRACEQSRISATVHVLVDLTTNSETQIREGLLQLTDYVGPHGGLKGRLTSIDKGVIGRCARTHVREHVDFADANEYQERMVREFGFTKQETARHTQTARSYLAYPLFHEQRFVGVLYFFTTEPQVFPAVADDNDLNDISREIVNYLSLANLV